MDNLFDKLRTNPQTQYPLGTFSAAISPLENMLGGLAQKRQKISGLKGIGFSDEEAKSLASLPDNMFETILKGLGQRGYSPSSSLQQLTPEGAQLNQPGLQELSQGPSSIRNILSMPTSAENREERKLFLKEKQIANQEKAKDREETIRLFKETAPYREKTLEAKNSAQAVLDDLSRMKELESGDAQLDTPGYIEFLERSGLDIPALMKPESEEFNKLRQTQLRDARQYFGGRVTNFEMDQFLKSIPSLNQSPEGRKRVIANMERINKLKVKTADVMRKIIKENGGVPPLDLAEQVDERMKKYRDRFAEEFKTDLKRKVPQSQSPYITAMQAIAGSAVPTVGKGIKGALGGALGGALVGGLTGGLPGAGLGALRGASLGGGLGTLGGLTNLF